MTIFETFFTTKDTKNTKKKKKKEEEESLSTNYTNYTKKKILNTELHRGKHRVAQSFKKEEDE